MTSITVAGCARPAVGLGVAAALLFSALGAPSIAWAQAGNSASTSASATTRDSWGLTDREWLTKTGPELRASLGFPGSASRVLAAAQAGDPKAAAVIAGAFAAGAGVPRDDAESLKWARAASAKGLPFGHYALALKYLHGGAAPVDMAEFERYQKLAADGGYVPAITALGLSLLEAPGNPEGRDPYLGREYMERAAAAGDPMAINLLEIWALNEAFVEAGDGMPMWKDGRGPLFGRHAFLSALHPCRTSVRGSDGGRWSINWTQTRAIGGVNGMIEFVGSIWVFDVNQASKVFGFFENEDASRNLTRSRANFSKLKEMADRLYLRCSTLGS